MYQGYAVDGLLFSWLFDGSIPSTVEERLSVRLTNNSNQPWDYDERMECLPDARNEIMLTEEDLSLFTLSAFPEEGIFGIGLNIHGDYHGLERADPWGGAIRARVNIARGGMMEISE